MLNSPNDDRPLDGVCVMVTRAASEADPLAERLLGLGAEVIEQPAILIRPPDDWRPVDRAIDDLEGFDWLVFSSANGVHFFMERCGRDLLSHQRPRVAAIGPGTAGELSRCGVKTSLTPEVYHAESLADALIETGAAGKRFLLVRASRGRETLAERLTAAGASVEQVVAYESVDVRRPDAEIAARLVAGRIDWITVTSSAIARSLVRMFGDDLCRVKLASISPLTSAALGELGFRASAEASEYTLPGLAAAIVATL